ncbi:MAG: hypothetical protein P8099_10330 [Gemmatimonadota bacterium]
MPIKIVFKDGTVRQATQDPAFGWYQVEGHSMRLGDRLVVAGIEREVVLTMDLPQATGIYFLPDFADPRCEPCGRRVNPPDAEWCKAHCEFWGEYTGRR